MKKKKTTTATTTTTTTTAFPPIDIKALISNTTDFFDDLINQIPAKFYLSTDADDKPWFQGLSKAEKAEAKKKSIENTKKARRERLDPDKAAKTTDVLAERMREECGGKGEEGKERGVTYEGLRERLRRKIESLRAAREVGEGGERRKEKREEWKKRRRESGRDGESDEGDDEGDDDYDEEGNKDVEKDVGREVDEAVKDIEFGKVKLAYGVEDGNKKKRRKLTKEQELKRALELEEAKKDPEKADVVKKHNWKAATERAMGVKVHDNPKLLKQSMHKEKKQHKKSVEKWKNREDTTHKLKQEKQDKRRGNIKEKIDRKKQKKIEKREKKLTNRAGFEGRKEGFVTG